MPRIALSQLCKNFRPPKRGPVAALDNFTLNIQNGEFLALAGPSGCGKTTLLRLIAGLDVPCSGSIILDDRSMEGVAPEQREVALVPQSAALFPHMTVEENLRFGLNLRRIGKAEKDEGFRSAVELLGLDGFLDRHPSELSGGQRQRAAIGRAIIRQPKVLLLDEPLSHLDAPARLQLRHDLAQLRKQIGATVIHVTHDQSEAMALGDRLVIMDQGRLLQAGSPGEVYDRPTSLFVARFVGNPPMTCFHGMLQPSRERGNTRFELFGATPDSTIPVWSMQGLEFQNQDPTIAGAIVLGLRAEDIHLAPPIASAASVADKSAGASGHLALPLSAAETSAPSACLAPIPIRIEWVEHAGADVWVHFQVNGQPGIARRTRREPLPKRDETGWTMTFESSRAHGFDAVSGQRLV